MVKFRCPTCGQKIAVNDEGAGVTIGCPNCADAIVVPHQTASEFRAAAPKPAAIPIQFNPSPPVHALGRDRPPQPYVEERSAPVAAASVRAAVMPHLARLMMNKLVQALFSQRAHLLDSQNAGTQRVVELEQRLIKAQQQVQHRLAAYEQRIVELEQQLALRERETHELRRNNLVIVRQMMEAQDQKSAPPTEKHAAAVLAPV